MARMEPSSAALEICSDIPKVELHAHLNGSIRPSTFLELARGAPAAELAAVQLLERSERSLAECFEIFDIIRLCVNDLDIVQRIAREVAEDFAAEGTSYLELRTTPKTIGGSSKADYVEAVLRGLEEAASCGCLTSLILSVDRTETLAQAMETIHLAVRYRGRVVGVDLCGAPDRGHFCSLKPAFEYARRAGLPFTCHVGEVDNEGELDEILAFRPERLGHLCYATNEQRELISQPIYRPALEICPTSNLVTTYHDLKSHHLKYWLSRDNLLAISTDDRLVFNTSLSRELALCMDAFSLERTDIVNLTRMALRASFASAEVKDKLLAQFT